MINVEPYLKFIIETRLTQSQFILLYMIHYIDVDRKKAFNMMKLYKEAFPSEDGMLIGRLMTDDLIKRGFLKKKDQNVATVDNFLVTDKFLDAFIDEYEGGNELWSIYPTFLQSGGKTMPLTAMDKNLFRELYWLAINGSREEHEEILKDVKYAVEKGLIRMKIENFVRSEGWEGLRKERLGVGATAKSNLMLNEDDL